MQAFLRRHGWGAVLWGMTGGIVIFYLKQLWSIRQGFFIAQRRLKRSTPPPSPLPHVTIIVPARNEQRNIRRCVASLLAQTYPFFDVVVVNDNSTDNTDAILNELKYLPHGERLTIIHGTALPDGWAGKPHAMAQGANVARGDLLLFTDADTYHRPESLAWAIEQARLYDADLLSLLTRQELVDRSNHIILPIIMMGIMAQYPPEAIADTRRPLALANGQYMLIRRETYDAIGGFAGTALHSSIVDDRDMATVVKASGSTVILLDGRPYVNVCMYQTFGDAWRGWSKNAYAGSRGGPLLFFLMAIGLPLGTVLPFVLWLVGIFSRKRALVIASSLQLASIAIYRNKLDQEVEHSRWWGMTHPLGGALLTGLLWRVAWRQFTGRGVEWNGRNYRVQQGIARPIKTTPPAHPPTTTLPYRSGE
jgi:chlorobactene glucosyltransferase